MGRKHLAWILLPAAVIVIAVVTFVLSNYQKEAGIAAPGKGGRATVSALAEARSAASGSGAAGYDAFSKALAVAMVQARNMAITNPAETRLQGVLANALDCLSASREAWQAELEQDWDPASQGARGFWQTLHPALVAEADEAPAGGAKTGGTETGGALTADQVRRWSDASADIWLQKALDLTE